MFCAGNIPEVVFDEDDGEETVEEKAKRLDKEERIKSLIFDNIKSVIFDENYR